MSSCSSFWKAHLGVSSSGKGVCPSSPGSSPGSPEAGQRLSLRCAACRGCAVGSSLPLWVLRQSQVGAALELGHAGLPAFSHVLKGLGSHLQRWHLAGLPLPALAWQLGVLTTLSGGVHQSQWAAAKLLCCRSKLQLSRAWLGEGSLHHGTWSEILSTARLCCFHRLHSVLPAASQCLLGCACNASTGLGGCCQARASSPS